VLEVIMNLSAADFEKLSQRILREAGFTQVEVTRRSGDDGIDGYGTLQINPLVSFKVLFNASVPEGRSAQTIFEIFAAQWPDERTKA
jgi:restriction endonuclease Mrr